MCCDCPLWQYSGRLTAFPLLSSSFVYAFSHLDTLSCAFVFIHTHTHIPHHLFSWLFFSDLNFLHLSVYIAVLGGDHVSDHVWQVRNKPYLFARVRVRCLRDLRGDIEARQDVLQGQLTDQDHRLTAKSYRTVPFSTALSSAIMGTTWQSKQGTTIGAIQNSVFCILC